MTENTKRLTEINRYIKKRSTGPPEEFARKLNISKSTLMRCLRFMRKRKAPICYDYITETYFYETIGSFEIGFRQEEVYTV